MVAMRRIPSLNGLKAFEAAARLGGFAAAAAELHVSPAAVSRMVRLLEDGLGLALFERAANRLTLTSAGQRYRAGLSPLFDAVETLTEEVRAEAGRRVLTIGVGPTFAMKWLIPRLADFQRTEPATELRFATGGQSMPFRDDWTCGIQLCDGDLPGLVCEPLFAADLLPVCTPALARGLAAPSDLARLPLLRVAHAPDDWPTWLAAAGVPDLAAHGPSFDYYGQALQAAADGLGVAMGIRPYIDDDLAAERLVAPFAVAVSKGQGWYLVYRPGRAEQPGFPAFRRWIAAAAERAR